MSGALLPEHRPVVGSWQSRRLQQAREVRGLPRKALAVQIGASKAQVSNWERGRREVPDYFKALICLSLRFPPSFFRQPYEEMPTGFNSLDIHVEIEHFTDEFQEAFDELLATMQPMTGRSEGWVKVKEDVIDRLIRICSED